MLDQNINCIVASPDGTRPIHVVRPDGLAAFLDTLPSGQAAFLRDTGFGGKSGELRCLPGADGLDGAVPRNWRRYITFCVRQPSSKTAGHMHVAPAAWRL